MLTTSIRNSSEPATRMEVCIQIHGINDERRRVIWVNPATISYFTETEPWREHGTPRPRWTLVSMTNGEQLKIDASPQQFAGWLRGDIPSDGARWADLQSDTQAIDGDQVV